MLEIKEEINSIHKEFEHFQGRGSSPIVTTVANAVGKTIEADFLSLDSPAIRNGLSEDEVFVDGECYLFPYGWFEKNVKTINSRDIIRDNKWMQVVHNYVNESNVDRGLEKIKKFFKDNFIVENEEIESTVKRLNILRKAKKHTYQLGTQNAMILLYSGNNEVRVLYPPVGIESKYVGFKITKNDILISDGRKRTDDVIELVDPKIYLNEVVVKKNSLSHLMKTLAIDCVPGGIASAFTTLWPLPLYTSYLYATQQIPAKDMWILPMSLFLSISVSLSFEFPNMYDDPEVYNVHHISIRKKGLISSFIDGLFKYPINSYRLHDYSLNFDVFGGMATIYESKSIGIPRKMPL